VELSPKSALMSRTLLSVTLWVWAASSILAELAYAADEGYVVEKVWINVIFL
jgi:hypothetical protein